MLAIAVHLLTGRYTATQFNDRNMAEWPPHPARLFSAMVAAWADSDEPDQAERSVLEWLENQEPPEICCGEGHKRRVVTHYVPVNDATALTRKMSGSYEAIIEGQKTLLLAEASRDEKRIHRQQRALANVKAKAVADAAKAGAASGRESAGEMRTVLQVLPENRGKQGRTYPTVLPDEPVICFTWPGARPSELQTQVLDGLLSRVGRLGHSSSLVSCRCVSDPPDPTWLPAVGGEMRLRVPRSGSIEALEDAYTIHKGEDPRTLPAGMVYYGKPGVQEELARSPKLGGDWYVLGIKSKERLRFPNAVQTLALTRATRNALLAHGDQPCPSFISGHQDSADGVGSTPPLERPHLAIVPLISAGHRYSDGAIFGLALVAPAELAEADRLALDRALSRWRSAGMALMLPARADGAPVRWEIEEPSIDRAASGPDWLYRGLPPRRKTTTREYWCRESTTWLTVTPIALDRFPGKLSSKDSRVRDRAESEAAASVARACVFEGLVERPEQVQVSVRLDAPLTGLPSSPSGRQHPGRLQYPGYRTGHGAPRVCVHAELKFDEPVLGPVLVGAGRYLGYGLCLPTAGNGGRE